MDHTAELVHSHLCIAVHNEYAETYVLRKWSRSGLAQTSLATIDCGYILLGFDPD